MSSFYPNYRSKEPRFTILSFLPEDRAIVRESVHRIPILGIRRKVLRGTVAKFSIFDSKLRVAFHCPAGYHIFLKKKKAIKFLNRNVKLPAEIGKEIIYQRRNIVNEITCENCGFTHSFPKRVIVVGTVEQATGPIHLTDPSWSLRCPHCPSQTTCTVKSV